MAKECGWSSNWILENLTLDQLVRYYQLIYTERMKLERLKTTAMGQAFACAFGTIKGDKFDEFLDALYKPNIDVESSLEQAKELGILEDANG